MHSCPSPIFLSVSNSGAFDAVLSNDVTVDSLGNIPGADYNKDKGNWWGRRSTRTSHTREVKPTESPKVESRYEILPKYGFVRLISVIFIFF